MTSPCRGNARTDVEITGSTELPIDALVRTRILSSEGTGSGNAPTDVEITELPIDAHVRTRTLSSESTDSSQGRELGMTSTVVGDLSISAAVLRGVTVARTLQRLGAMWRVSPCDMEPRQLRKIHHLSHECDSLDTFISHVWSSPWWQRYLTMLLYFYLRPAIVAATALLLVMTALDLASLLPMTTIEPSFNLPFRVQKACWFGAPSIVGLLTLLVSPMLGLGHRNRNVFLDALCINQVDDALKNQGISSLGGFLDKSNEMIVLWTPSHMQRLWCVYEVAVFSKLKGPERIRWCPIFHYAAAFFVFCCKTWFYFINDLRHILDVTNGMSIAYGIVNILWVVLVAVVLHGFWGFIRSKASFLSALPALSCTDAECREASDREFIVQSIEYWYGSVTRFNEYLRGPVSQQIARALAGTGVTYRVLVVCIFPPASACIAWGIAYWRAGVSLRMVLTYSLMDFCQTLCLMPLCLKLIWVGANVCRHRWKLPAVDVALSTLVAAAYTVGMQFWPFITNRFAHQIWLSVAYITCCVVLSYMAFSWAARPHTIGTVDP